MVDVNPERQETKPQTPLFKELFGVCVPGRVASVLLQLPAVAPLEK